MITTDKMKSLKTKKQTVPKSLNEHNIHNDAKYRPPPKQKLTVLVYDGPRDIS